MSTRERLGLRRLSPRYARLRSLATTVAVAASATVGVGCDGLQRFPICHTDKECADREGGKDAPLCFNLKCVACRYDTDCAAGEICTGNNRCDTLTSEAPNDDSDSAPRVSPASPDACSTRCKDAACIEHCRQKTEKK